MNELTMGRLFSTRAIEVQMALLSAVLAVVILGAPLLAYWEYKLVKGHIGTDVWSTVFADVISAEVRNP